ncbi:MAG: ATP-binding cassette domain-containing protein [Phycisphaerales bacterium]
MPDALEIRDLRFAYPGAAWSLVVPTLTLAAGEQMLLVGGSGRGKSTLLQLIAGLRDAQAGTIAVAGTGIAALRGAARDTARGRSIGMIFQTFNLLHGFSALDNVLAALMFSAMDPRQHEERALSLLGALGIDRPESEVDRLSVGQQQRVAVARALAARPALVLADEPTASLDPENTAAAMDLIQQACRADGAALLCTSHDPAMRARFPRVETIDDFVRGGQEAAR